MDNTTPRDYQFLRYVEDSPVARPTLNRPQKRNVLSIALSDELVRAIVSKPAAHLEKGAHT